jgi:hypothetical protein
MLPESTPFCDPPFSRRTPACARGRNEPDASQAATVFTPDMTIHAGAGTSFARETGASRTATAGRTAETESFRPGMAISTAEMTTLAAETATRAVEMTGCAVEMTSFPVEMTSFRVEMTSFTVEMGSFTVEMASFVMETALLRAGSAT